MSFTWVDAGSDNTHASSNGSVGAGDKSTGGDENANASATRQKRGNFNYCCDFVSLLLYIPLPQRILLLTSIHSNPKF